MVSGSVSVLIYNWNQFHGHYGLVSSRNDRKSFQGESVAEKYWVCEKCVGKGPGPSMKTRRTKSEKAMAVVAGPSQQPDPPKSSERSESMSGTLGMQYSYVRSLVYIHRRTSQIWCCHDVVVVYFLHSLLFLCLERSTSRS